MSWCEANGVDYLLGLARTLVCSGFWAASCTRRSCDSRHRRASRVFKDFTYRTQKSWSRERRVVGKAEHLAKGSNPRFVVTSLSAEELTPARCTKSATVLVAKWRTESRSSRCVCSPTARVARRCGRTSCGCGCRAWRTCFWWRCVSRPARHGDVARALRYDPLEVLKIGALVRTTVRRVWISLSRVSVPAAVAQAFENYNGGGRRCRLRDRTIRSENQRFPRPPRRDPARTASQRRLHGPSSPPAASPAFVTVVTPLSDLARPPLNAACRGVVRKRASP